MARDQRSLPGHSRRRDNASPLLNVDTSADRVRTLHACRARTSFIAPRSRLTFEEVKSSVFPRRNSASTCTLFANANAAWSRRGMLCIWTITKKAERNSSWAPGALLALELWRSHSQREQRVNCEEGTLSSAQVRAQCSTGFLALLMRNLSHTSKHWNWMIYLNICWSSAAVM